MKDKNEFVGINAILELLSCALAGRPGSHNHTDKFCTSVELFMDLLDCNFYATPGSADMGGGFSLFAMKFPSFAFKKQKKKKKKKTYTPPEL
jgi:hypothetical protein